MCRNIRSAWDFCDQASEKADSELIPSYETCEENDAECISGNDEKEKKCRKDILGYFSKMYSNEKVYESYKEVEEFRNDFMSLCRTISLGNAEQHPFPLDSDNDNQFLDAISEIGETCITDDNEDECDFDLDIHLNIAGEVTQINDKYSIDLDLYFTKEDM